MAREAVYIIILNSKPFFRSLGSLCVCVSREQGRPTSSLADPRFTNAQRPPLFSFRILLSQKESHILIYSSSFNLDN